MNLISYADLARLRLSEFVDEGVDVEESGVVGLVGLGGWERVGDSYFAWKQGELFQTAGVDLDLGRQSLLGKEIACRLIERLGLPVTAGMNPNEAIRLFGTPMKEKTGRTGVRQLDFICGSEEPFRLGCFFDGEAGLVGFFLARKDCLDQDASS